MSNKTTVIYHSADFDGIFCQEIARKFLGDENVTYIGWNFGDPVVSIPPSGTIYVLDLPIDAVFGTAFWNRDEPSKGGEPILERIIWIDHHKTSIETHPASIPGYRIDGVAACRLAWQWFTSSRGDNVVGTRSPTILPDKQDFIDRNVSEPLAVRLAGEYDIWDKRDPDAEVFQFGLKSNELDTADFGLMLVGPESFARGIIRSGHQTKRYQRAQDREHMTRSFEVKWEGLTFLAYNGRGNSLTFNSAILPSHDALLLFHYSGPEKGYMVSLYHAPGKEHHDLSLIAKRYKGGGHRGACGFVCKALPFENCST